MSLVEITGWTAYFVYTNKGNDIRTEFREYADTYWDEAGYRAWHEGFDENLTVEEKLQFQQDFGIAHPDMYSHTLEVEHTQQYYEMIGKYNQYTAYWEDYDPALHAPNRPGSTITPMRDHYETRRHDHNVQLKRATMAATVIFLNRLASLMDTLLLVKGRSNQDAHMRVAFDTEKCSFGSVPTAGLQLKF